MTMLLMALLLTAHYAIMHKVVSAIQVLPVCSLIT